jgi:hypothetical protein
MVGEITMVFLDQIDGNKFIIVVELMETPLADNDILMIALDIR